MTNPRASILAIDDTPANLLTLGAALGADFDLQIATSGAAGLALAHALAPDLILLDVMMPEMDGYETCRRLKDDPQLRGIPVIFLTALQECESESFGLSLGAVDYITKPLNVEITRHRICNLLERERLRRQVESERDRLDHMVKERTAQLRERMEQLDAIFALSPDGFVSFDQSKRVSQVSPSFSRLTGLPEDVVIGLDDAGFTAKLAGLCVATAAYRGIDEQAALMKLDSTRRNGEDCDRVELKVPKGRVLEVALRHSNVETASQILYLRDVTRDAEIDRMKSEFLEMAAHELRTPLTSVLGYTEVLLDEKMDETLQREMLTTIHHQAQLVTSIVNELLDLVRINSRKGQDFVFEKLTLREVVDGVVSAYKLPAGRQSPVIRLPERSLAMSADRRKIEQVLCNLISNAYKYSPGGGEVSIDYQTASHEGSRLLGIEVRDHGMGMTPEQQARCFERFYRADASGKIPGTGLGMCIVKEIMDLHGGRIVIQSALGQGTAVTIWLAEVAS